MEQDDGHTLVLWALHPGHFRPAPDVRQVLAPAEKCPHNPVLSPRPGHWDGTRCKVYGTVLHDAEEHLFKMWYSGGTDTPEAMRRECGSPRRVGYATSEDGIHWRREPLGVVAYQGSRDNNLVLLDGQAPNVFKLPDEPDPARRYLMLVQAGQRTEHNRMLVSPDGLHWEPVAEDPLDPAAGGQVHEPFSVLHDPGDPDPTRRWKGYSLLHMSGQGGYRGRAVGLYLSADLHTWQPYPEQPILDASTGLESEIHLPHVSRFHDCYVLLYDAMEPWHDTQTEIAIGDDAVHFHRIQNGVPVVPRGAPGDHDAAKVCVSPRSLFVHAGKIWWYYTCSANNYQTGPRSGRAEPWYRYTCLAWWREDGFAYLTAEAGAAAVETTAFRATGLAPPPAWINAVCDRPISVELCAGRRVMARGAVTPGDHLRAPVRWEKQTGAIPQTDVHLRLVLPGQARLYAVYLQGATRSTTSPVGPGAFLTGANRKAQIVPHPTPARRWSFACGKVTAQPLSDGERVYVGTWDEHIYALDLRTGRLVWQHRCANAVVAGGVLLGERVFFGSRDGCVYALDRATGKEQWRCALAGGPGVPTPNGPWIECPPAVGQWRPDWGEGEDRLYRIFVGSHHRRLVALDPADGRRCWEFPTFNWILGRPVVAGYTVYCASLDGYCYALDAALGALQWRYQVGKELRYAATVIPGSVSTKAVSAAPLLHQGVLFVPAHDGFVHALEAASGRTRWVRELGQTLSGAAIICGDTLVLAGNPGTVFGLHWQSGETRWEWEAGEAIHADPIPSGPQTCLVITARGRLVQLTAAGEVTAQRRLGCRVRATPSLTPEGDLLVGTIEGELCCLPVADFIST